jgi:myosin-1
VAYLFEVEFESLKKALTHRTLETSRGGKRGSVYDVPLNVVQVNQLQHTRSITGLNTDKATAVRDALSKEIYSRLFDWIVDRVNKAMAQRSQSSLTLGVLDIYGFEIFEVWHFR